MKKSVFLICCYVVLKLYIYNNKLIYLMTNLGGNSSPIVLLMFLPLVSFFFIYLIFSQIMVYLYNGFQNIPNE
jgi:hypothetical protein